MTNSEIPVDEVVDHKSDPEDEVGKHRAALSSDRADEILDAISVMEVELDDDPILRGPKFLVAKVAECRNHMNAAQRMLEEIHRKKTVVRRRLNSLESQYDIKYDRLMVSDPDVQDCRAQKQRESMVRFKLSDTRIEIEDLKLEITEIKSLEEVVSSKYTHLRETGWDISRQQKLIRDEMKIGGGWGDESEYDAPSSKGTNAADPVDFDADEMDAAVEAEGSEKASAEIPEQDPEDDFDIDELLEGIPDDFDDEPEEPPLNLSGTTDPDSFGDSMSEMDLEVDVDDYLKSPERDDNREFQVDRTEVRFDDFDMP